MNRMMQCLNGCHHMLLARKPDYELFMEFEIDNGGYVVRFGVAQDLEERYTQSLSQAVRWYEEGINVGN